MPLYEYQCDACGERFEAIRKFSDPPLEVCEKCGKGPVQRLVSSPAFQFKGSGWYITDYAKKDSGSKKDGGSATGSSTSKADTAPSDKSASGASESAKSDTSSKPASAGGSNGTTGGSKD